MVVARARGRAEGSCLLIERTEYLATALSVHKVVGARTGRWWWSQLLLFCPFLTYFLVAQKIESTCRAGDLSSILGSGRSPGEGNGYALQFSYLDNSMDRGAWQVTGRGVAKSRTRLRD